MLDSKQDTLTPVPLLDVFPQLLSQGFMIYAGAGISMAAPTCAPSWWQLTEEILTSFFDRIPREWGVPSDLIIKSEIWQPEVIFENFANVFDTQLYEVFKALDVATPNGTHRAIAKLAKEGYLKSCVTTNFDIYIERALRDEGVEFELLVDNAEYNAYFDKIKQGIADDRFVLCKIHGTIENPNSIVSVASAYKSTKGFSTPKALVINQFVQQFPCLFLGYSGWDFEHNNYRKFWDDIGPRVKAIYWNRRTDDRTGPNFQEIFRRCIDKFQFTEADLPMTLVRVLENALNTDVSGVMTNVSLDDIAWDKAKKQRMEFLQGWARELQDIPALAAVINNGMIFSVKFQEYMKNMKTDKDTRYDWGAEMQQISSDVSKEKLRLYDEITAGTITEAEYQSQLDAQIEKSVYSFIREPFRSAIKEIIDRNEYPGFTDDHDTRVAIIQKMGEPVSHEMSPADALSLAIERVQAEQTAAGDLADIERIFSNVYLSMVSPNAEEWNALYEELSSLKSRAISGEITKEEYSTNAYALKSKAFQQSMGNNIPLEDLFGKLISSFYSVQDAQELLDNAAILSLTARSVPFFLTNLLKTPEFVALRTATMAPTANDYLNQYDPVGYMALLRDLQDKAARGEVPAGEFSTQISEAMIKQGEFYATPLTKPFEVSLVGSRPPIPRVVVENYDRAISDVFEPFFQAAGKFTASDVIEAKIMVDVCLIKLWNMSFFGLDMLGGSQMTNCGYAGKYPLFTCNPDITSVLQERYHHDIDKAFELLPARFGQIFCEGVVDLAFAFDDLELCEQATLQSLKYSEGAVNESTPANIPVVLAQMLENRGDKENALKYYVIALEGVRNFTPPMYADVIVYRSALLTLENGDKEEALKILGLYHPAFHGKESDLKVNARTYARVLADEIASDMGYTNTEDAIADILK
ncbi:MAG TPA: SIR2 family protein [Candidatus Lokiarchaeia archaeon]|nr:SIR2 family protein [Candidatus Lokiarchaeia archaeon]